MLRCPGSSWGFGALLKGLTSFVVLKVERMLVIHSPHRQFLPEPRFEPTTSGYKSDALSIRPRLPVTPIYFRTSRYQINLAAGAVQKLLLAGQFWPVGRLLPTTALVFATLEILSMHNQLVTLQREKKTRNLFI